MIVNGQEIYNIVSNCVVVVVVGSAVKEVD